MATYSFDIGTWERGYMIEVQANDLEEAFKLAEAKVRNPEDDFVQARRNGLLIWDQMNSGYDERLILSTRATSGELG